MIIQKYNSGKLTVEARMGDCYEKISLEACLVLKLDLNDCWSEDEVRAVRALSEEIFCRNYLAEQISTYPKTVQGYRKKLYEKGFCSSVIRKTLEHATEIGLLDDRKFAEQYSVNNQNRKGSFRIKNELRQKGVSRDILNALAFDEDNNADTVYQLAKKYLKQRELTPELREKLYRHLSQKGFSYSEFKSCVSRLLDPTDTFDLD